VIILKKPNSHWTCQVQWVQFLRAPAVVFVMLLGLFAAGQAVAVSIGPGLQMLSKIQGQWQRQCRPVGLTPRQGYKIERVSISFTHMDFLAIVYEDDECKQEKTRWPAKFKFVLGDPLVFDTAPQQQVFALELLEVTDPAQAWELSPSTVMSYHQGHLYFGRESPLGSTSTRLSTLERDFPFSRR
jgi:hypothetical protein